MTAQIDMTAEMAGNKMPSSGSRNGHDGNGENEVANGNTENRLHDKFIEALRNNPNAYPVTTIKQTIKNDYNDDYNVLRHVFDKNRLKAIKNYEAPDPLPSVGYRKPKNNYIEVYFWGLRGTGKTCTIGSVIGYLTDEERIKTNRRANGRNYIRKLQNLFSEEKEDGIVRLPGSTTIQTLPVMPIKIKDRDSKWHYANIIDVAGENFNGIYRENNGDGSSCTNASAVNNLTKCLKNGRNYKIHFFIIEYGKDSKTDGEPNSRIIRRLIEDFDKTNLFGFLSVGMFVLFTKCDKINIPKNADAETKEKTRSDAIEEYCKNNQDVDKLIKCIKKIAQKRQCTFDQHTFSIGDVFAQDLCNADYSDAEKIVNIIESHSPAHDDGLLERVFDFLAQ